MYKMSEKNFLLQTLLLPLVLLSGHEYGETRQLALTPDAPSRRLLGEAIPGNSTDTTWNLIGPPGSRLHLNCTDQTLLKSANCSEGSLSIFENGEEEEIWSKEQSTVYSRQSEGNRLTVRIKTEPSTCSGGRVSCDISLMKGSPLTDSGDYADLNVQNDPKTSNPNEGNERKRIVMGAPMRRTNIFPFMAVIETSLLQISVRCGGTILTKRHVLTAAHCVHDHNSVPLWVTVGAHDLSDLRTAQTLAIQAMYRHADDVEGRILHDVAVLLLQYDINLHPSRPVRRVFLPGAPYHFINNYLAALGWGEMSPTGAPSTDLRTGILYTLPLTACSTVRRGDVFLNNPTQICSYGGGYDTCKSDSGGPLILWDHTIGQFVQVGLITDRRDCVAPGGAGQPHTWGLNTELSHYVPWIERIVSQTVPGLTCQLA